MTPPVERPPRASARVAAHYDRHVVAFTRAYTEAMLDAVAGRRPACVLDHGAGTGTLTRRLLAEHPGASVVALDPSTGMLERLGRGLADEDRPRVEIVCGTASDLCDHGPFDLVVSQLAFMFSDDVEGDLTAIRRCATRGARLVVSVLGGPSDVVAFERYWAAAAAAIPDLAGPEAYPHFRFADPGSLEEAVARSGWGDVRCSRVAASRELAEADLWRWLSGSLPLRRVGGEPATLTRAQRSRLRARLDATTEDLRGPGGLLGVPMNGWLIEAVAA